MRNTNTTFYATPTAIFVICVIKHKWRFKWNLSETRKLLQSDAFDADALDDAEKSTLDVLFVETIDVLECRQLVDQALTTSTTVALNVVVDKIAEKFPATRVGSDDGGLLHPGKHRGPEGLGSGRAGGQVGKSYPPPKSSSTTLSLRLVTAIW